MFFVFFRSDEHILQRSGRDAIQYLSFQRYLMVYMTIVVVVCIGIILPVNFSGEQGSNLISLLFLVQHESG
jgi:hypothetical protein